MIGIRDAGADDAPAICGLLRRSIAELCLEDHGDDPVVLGRWLGNKTPENVAAWIARPDSSLFVAEEGDTVLAVGAVTEAGEITLNYVLPDARFRGVSRAILVALEARAAERGRDRCVLHSTVTAHRFYLGAGYADDGPPETLFGMTSYPMSKRLLA